FRVSRLFTATTVLNSYFDLSTTPFDCVAASKGSSGNPFFTTSLSTRFERKASQWECISPAHATSLFLYFSYGFTFSIYSAPFLLCPPHVRLFYPHPSQCSLYSRSLSLM